MKTNNISIHNTLKNYYSLFIINCSLKTAFLLFIIHCSLFIKRKLFNVRSSLKTAFLLFIIHCSLFISNAQSIDQNYIKTKECLNNDCSQYKQTITYFDGLGRPKQTLILKATPQGNDIATPIEYDGFGRQPKDYLPVPTAQNNGNYIPDLVPTVQSYYNTSDYDNTQNPYSEKELEASPLNRVLKQAAPGNSWKLGSGHEVKLDYQTNTATDAVRLFRAQTTWNSTQKKYDITLQENGTYANGQLYKTITKDENWTSGTLNTIEEYKDKEGHVVLKRTYVADDNGNPIQADTYYIYDLYGNLTYVLPPKLSVNSSLLTINSSLNDLGYQYIYDARNRLVEKKLPGKAWEYMVYDKQDRLVGTATYKGIDGEDFGNAIRWLFTKYDKFSRPVYTGIYNVSINRYDLQTQIDALASNNEQSNTTGFAQNGITCYYTQTAFPTANFTLLSITYYDAYPAGSPTAPTTIESQAVQSGTALKTLPTATYTAILPNTAGATVTLWEKTYTYYDTKSRPIRLLTQNHLGGYTQTDSKLDFRGKPDYTFTYHKRTNTDTELKTKELFVYDAQERLLTHSHQINDGTIELLTQNQYDALGQLTHKRVGGQAAGAGLQKVDYTYNIRGWLKSINDINSLNEDLFAFKINYNGVENPSTGISPLYNGNIAETMWRSSSDNIKRSYGYQYDALNRLTNAVYGKPESSVSITNNYNEQLTYDLNGNILTLNRNGNMDAAEYLMQIDQLSYTYDNGNKLLKVTDATNSPDGFKDDSDGTNDTANDYTYDSNGNMITDQNKGITAISYNYLHLPVEIMIGTGKIQYTYTASGAKLQKKVYTTLTSTLPETTDYLNGYQYVSNVLQFFPTAEGYVKNTVVNGANTFDYIYNYTDHLGNIRVSYTKDPSTNMLKIMEENHYYPFGLKHTYNLPWLKIEYDPTLSSKKIKPSIVKNFYKYKYNGKEFQDELNLNLYDYGARNYDAALGRWFGIDPLADLYEDISPYQYALNDPIRYTDPDGMAVSDNVSEDECPTCNEVLPDVIIPAKKKNETLEYIQTGLDVIGIFDPFGIADGLNAAIYLANGDYKNAAISAMGIIPVVGDLGKGLKYGIKAADKVDDVIDATRGIQGVYEITTKSGKKYIGKSKDVAKRLKNHKRSKFANDKIVDVKVTEVKGNAKDLAAYEHQTLMKVTEGKHPKVVKDVLNERLPVGEARKDIRTNTVTTGRTFGN